MSRNVNHIFLEIKAKLFVNRGDPDQMLHSVESDLGLHCLSVKLLGVSGLKWVTSLYFS